MYVAMCVLSLGTPLPVSEVLVSLKAKIGKSAAREPPILPSRAHGTEDFQ